MDKKVEILEKRNLVDGFFKIEEAVIRHEKFDGSMSKAMKRLVVERGDAVAALVYNTDNEVYYLIEQFRFAPHLRGQGWLKEIVAGMIDKGESPIEAIERELKEEIGYAPSRLEPIASVFASPGGSTEKLHLFYAETNNSLKVAPGIYHLDEDEDIKLLEVKREDLLSLVEADGTVDSKTLLTLYWLQFRR